MQKPHEQTDPRQIGRRLAEARKARGLTQQEAADHLGVSRPTLSATEKGKRPAQTEELIDLAELYGRSVHDIVGRKAPPVELVPHLRAAVQPGQKGKRTIEQAIQEFQELADDYRELEKLAGVRPAGGQPDEVALPGGVRATVQFAEDVAERERRRLSVGGQPLFSIRRLLEDGAGLAVFCSGLPSNIAGMYACVAQLGYCILVNQKHPQERQRWTLAHEYGHFLVNRHEPGVDYLGTEKRKPANEHFCDSFAANFLMPRATVRSRFYDVMNSKDDFQVSDLCKLSTDFAVSVQAMARRLGDLDLIDSGTWDFLQERGFKPDVAKQELQLESTLDERQEIYPQRYKYLAVTVYCQGRITETQLANFLRTDRVSAREIMQRCISRLELTEEGKEKILELPFERSLL